MVKPILRITGGVVILSACIIVALYALHYKPLRYRGGFVRDFERVQLVQKRVFDLKTDGHYLAGISGGEVFIGTEPDSLRLLVIDTAFTSSRPIDVTFSVREDGIPATGASANDGLSAVPKLLGARIEIDSPFFFIRSMMPPETFRGSMADWHATFLLKTGLGSITSPAGSGNMVLMEVDTARQKDEVCRNTLFKVWDSGEACAISKKLDKEKDTWADSRGMLRHAKVLGKFVYLYEYRNRWLVIDSILSVVSAGHTIDTVKHVFIEPGKIHGVDYALSGAPAVINKDAHVSGHLLFVHSDMMSSNESKTMFDHSAVIDVYDLRDQTYQYSFYLPDHESNPMTDFEVFDGMIVAVFGRYLMLFVLDAKVTNSP